MEFGVSEQHFKSIVYGDPVKNKYGLFRCFCATVSSEDQIESIVNYLKRNPVFNRLKKYGYAYRISMVVDEMDIVVEDCKNDDKLEGCGEKILHLLQKFNVENVLLIMGIDRNDSFSIMNPEYYHVIIERAKDLLSTLYEKVIENELNKRQGYEENSIQQQQSQYSQQQVKYDSKANKYELQMKNKYIGFDNLPGQEIQRKKAQERPNYYLTNQQKQIQRQAVNSHFTASDREKITANFLRKNIERNNEKIGQILDNMSDNDYQYLKFMCLYDKNSKVEKVFKMLMLLEDVKNLQDLSQNYDFKTRIPLISRSFIGKEKTKKVIDMLRIDRYLNPKILMAENYVIANLLEYMTLIVRNYEISQKILDLELKKNSDKQNTENADRNEEPFQRYDDQLAIDMTMTKNMNPLLQGPMRIKVEDTTTQEQQRHGQSQNEVESSRYNKESVSQKESQRTIKKDSARTGERDGGDLSQKLNELKSSRPGSAEYEEEQEQAETKNTKPSEDIPYDPEEIKRYLEIHPIETQPNENLEIIAERLKNHRVNN